ncbi:MAG: hypothetical protein B6D56_05390 [Candidatus Omnitrophica bacterium 4484_70.1]|nr:MAG: hypothetical protein B6D56_05390 [Candidatus Omnitrophica bacterium 4484_70.1]
MERGERRFNFRFPIKYEKILEDGTFTIPVATFTKDISSSDLSFYTSEIIRLNLNVRVYFSLSSEESVSFVGRVVRVEESEKEDLGKYITVVEIKNISEEERNKLTKFLGYADIGRILEKIDLENVVDIHFVGGYPPIVKKFNKLVPLDMEPLSKEKVRNLLLNILDDYQYRIFKQQKEINFIFSYKDARFRVNLHFQQGNVEGTFRVVPSEIKTLKELRLPPVVEEFLNNKKGLILVAGRTGSGKTTTLASMVEYLNTTREGIIICIEDPIEYVHTNKKCIIKQREVGKDTLSFFNAAKNALRQNPDILVIGEILDAETMDITLTAAESGTLVLTSLHAPNSAYALDRIVSLFPAELQFHILTRLSLVLLGIITQELVPRADGRGLVLASEVLVINDALRRIIRQGDWKQISTFLQTGRAIGMRSMEESLRELYREGLIGREYLMNV